MQNNKKKVSFGVFARLFARLVGRMFSGHPFLFLSSLLLIIIGMAVQTAGTMFVSKILIDNFIKPSLDNGFAPGQIKGDVLWFSDVPLFAAVSGLALVYAVGIVSVWGYRTMSCVIGQSTQKKIRDELFDHMESLPLRYFDTRTHGDIMSVYTNDVDTLRELTSRVLPMVVQMIFSMISSLVGMLLAGSWVLLSIVFLFFLIIVTAIAVVTKISTKYFIDMQRVLGKTNGYIEEMISGQKVIKVFNHEKEAEAGFDALNEELFVNAVKTSQFSSILGPVTNNLSNLMYVVIGIVGASIIASEMAAGIPVEARTLTAGTVILFLSLGKTFIMPIGQLSNQINMLILAMAGAGRIFAIIDEQPEVDEGYVTLVNAKEGADGNPVEATDKTGLWAWKHPHDDGRIEYKWLRGKINMYDVDFGYVPGKIVLHDIKLYAEPGQKIAFVGPTGAGKTTITNLLNRFYDIEDGKIRFDDININKIKKKDLRRAMGMVLQDTNLFTDTVKENIRYGNPEATDEEVEMAAKLANADGFIRMLPEGYNTVLRNAGAGLSQGQRQLLSIARAACANPPVLVLDEATSSIDSRTEKLVQQGMDAIMNGRTVFVIAHRLSTIQNSDVIMVLEDGRIIERGSHDSLLQAKGKYYQLYTGGLASE